MKYAFNETGHSRIAMTAVAAGLWFAIGFPTPAAATDKTLPSTEYYFAFQPYYQGEYREALGAFRDAARGGYIGVDGRWIDAICYHTMTGECYYHLGELGLAVEQYESALKLFLAYKDWMLRVEFPDTIEPSAAAGRARITWGVSTRAPKLGQVPEQLTAMTGRMDNDRVIRQGGIVDPPEFRALRVHEIVRCTALAIRRRKDILGPTCKLDPFTHELVRALSTRPAPPNHWSQAWIDVQLGLALASADRVPEAIAALTKGVALGGIYDHPVTAAALLELGKLAFQQKQFKTAAQLLFEATLSAANFEQFDDMEEAFRYGTMNHLVSGQRGMYAPLPNALAWARQRGSKPLQTSLAVLASECSTAFGETAAAATFLEQGRAPMSRNDLSVSRLGARFQYQSAHVSFQRRDITAGNASLAAAMTLQRKGSTRLFQIAIADKLFVNGVTSPRVSEQLFSEVLRDPTAEDWKLDPLESMSVIATPHLVPLEHWFELTLNDRKEIERAFAISELIRRHRFYSTLPAGGRLLALRWILEAPKEALNDAARLQRQDFLLRYPTYAELSQQAQAANEHLRRMPLTPKDDEAKKLQTQWYEQLAALSLTQEALISDIALRREPSEFVFPPILPLDEIRAAMAPAQLTLAFFNTTRAVYVFVIGKEQFSHHQVSNPQAIRKELIAMLRAMGNFERNQTLLPSNLTDDSWKVPARKILEMLIPASEGDPWEGFDELAIVPDGVLWYVPFECLPTRNGPPLISEIRVRYAPTVSTTLPDGRGHRRESRTAVVTGKMFPRDDDTVTALAFADLQARLPTAMSVADELPAPSGLVAAVCDRLVVWDEIDDAGGPYAWSPMQIDRGRPDSSLSHWFMLPWQSPEQIALPGYQSPAADGLRKGGSGDEMFLTVCGLMSTGARSILLSRWRTGGQTSFDLTREYVQQLPATSATKAWFRAVHLVAMSGEIIPDLEPRLKVGRLDEPLAADHPFFWAGYLLVDTGSAPQEDREVPPGEVAPAADVKK